ncbi:uncharacterized protein LOC102729845 isoform X1 [Leptonychotes weddellii]|uniref:Uncharacterized protein LOC102729845 isoform X1 n=1 Tax=Leptonychotes weddellii TaxID=9713 RepID=A0A7F8R7G0_LEPWE|nr:uncharacterized protein LOC102729845 isoform X1 [Leptonychotes weddellii]
MESAGSARDRVPRIDPYGFERPEDFDYAAYEEFFSTYLVILTRRAIKWSKLLKGSSRVQRSGTGFAWDAASRRPSQAPVWDGRSFLLHPHSPARSVLLLLPSGCVTGAYLVCCIPAGIKPPPCSGVCPVLPFERGEPTD